MANIIVVPFQDETKAIEALHKIKELDAYGDITLYEHMMIRKKDNNKYEVLNDATDGEGWRTFTGMALGGLVGAFGGPLGLIIGLYTGTAVGAAWDISRYDFEDEFIKKVSNKMTAGTIAIVAEVAEDGTVFLDEALKMYSPEFVRTEAGVEFDDYVDEQILELEEEIDNERAKLKKATAEEKAKIKSKISDLKAKRKMELTKLETKREAAIKEIKNKTKARINKLESRLKSYEASVSDSISQTKVKILEKKIEKQKSKLSKLNRQLEEVLL